MSSIYLRGKVYWYKRSVKGKPYYQSLKTSSKRVATSLQKKLDKNFSNPTKKSESNDNILQLIENYLNWLGQSVSEKHLEHCRSRLIKFADYSGQIQVEHITVETVQTFLDQLDLSAKTKNYYKYAISKFLKYCFNRGFDVDLLAARATMTPTTKRHPPRFLTMQEEIVLLRRAYRFDKNLYLRIIVAIRTGMRMSEIRRMRWEHIDFNANTIFIPKSKHRYRTIPLHKTLKKRLHKIRKKSGPVFSGAARTWSKELCKVRTSIFTNQMGEKSTGRGWHLFRHTFASRLVQAGVDIFKVSKWLGHTSVTTTMIYAHLAPNNYDDDINRL